MAFTKTLPTNSDVSYFNQWVQLKLTGTTPTAAGDVIELASADPGVHFRQDTFTLDATLEIDTQIFVEDTARTTRTISISVTNTTNAADITPNIAVKITRLYISLVPDKLAAKDTEWGNLDPTNPDTTITV